MAFWLYAAGASGQPRAIVHLQHDLAFAAACQARNVLGLSAADRCLSYSPWHTAAGLCATLAYPFIAGASSVTRPIAAAGEVAPRRDPLADILAFKPTLVFGEPEHYAHILAASAGGSRAPQGVRACFSSSPLPGGGGAHAGLSDAFRQRFGKAIIESLGSPETLCAFISATPDIHKPGTLGRRVPGFELMLTNGEGQPVRDGTEGVLRVRGHSSAPCYWNRPEETARTMGSDGWLSTGERLVRDVYGFYARPRRFA